MLSTIRLYGTVHRSNGVHMRQRDFYQSSQWYKTANSYRKHVYNLCERCGKPTWRKNDKRYIELKEQGEDVRFGIVHHKVHLNALNINDPYITLSFDNLELLCIDCHNKEHMETTPEIRDDVKFDNEGRVING